MSKVSLDIVSEILAKQVKNPDLVDSVLNELNKIVAEGKIEREENKQTKAKNEYCIILMDETGELEGKVSAGYVVQYKAGDDAGAVLSKLKEAVSEQNSGMKKFIKNPIKSMTDALANLKRKYLKGNKNLLIKTAEPVRVLLSNNKLV